MLEHVLIGYYQGLALFLLRVVLGITFVVHGFPKIANLARTRKNFASMGVPVPALASLYAAVAESLGGMLMIVGFYTGWAGIALIVDMIGAMIFVQWREPFKGGWEVNLLLLFMAVAILLAGPGDYRLELYI